MITFDEGGGYYDSGYVQPLDLLRRRHAHSIAGGLSVYERRKDFTRLCGSRFSFLKFIERNWNMGPVTKRSRDNLPNPVISSANPYVPDNSPAISDLFDLFSFGRGNR